MSGMGVDGAHNTVGQMSAPTTLFGFWPTWKVAGHPSDMSCRLLSYRCAGYGPRYCGQLECPALLAPSVFWSSPSERLWSIGPSWLRLRQSEKSCKQGFGASLVGDAGQSRKRCLARPFGRRGGPKSKASVDLLWPGLPIGEAGRSQKRALFLSEAFRSEIGSPF